MPDFQGAVRGMKRAAFGEAWEIALPVRKPSGERIGRLVPVGEWILGDEEKIGLVCAWRRTAMRMFLTQFESTPERTRGYFERLAIPRADRLFFLIYDDADRMIGHVGMANLDGRGGLVDNLVRGVEGGGRRLVYFAELALLDWCFRVLGLAESDAKVLSPNWLAIGLYEEIGYVVTREIPLRRHEKDGAVLHDFVGPEEANVDYTCVDMLLTREAFYRGAGWLLA